MAPARCRLTMQWSRYANVALALQEKSKASATYDAQLIADVRRHYRLSRLRRCSLGYLLSLAQDCPSFLSGANSSRLKLSERIASEGFIGREQVEI